MRSQEFIDEVVNKQVFSRGFRREKSFTDRGGEEYKLIALVDSKNITDNIDMSNTFSLEAWHNGKMVGWANFEIHGDEIRAQSVAVEKAYRRRGLANAMYDFVEELGNTVAPSALQKPDGRALWQGRNKRKEINTVS
jgi:ribosomal protein S18 acetylase RimI-like enzyme